MRMMFTTSLLVLLISCVTGCGVQPQSVSHGNHPGDWIKADDSKSVMLEENLLRVNIYVVFDGSGSMSGNKIEEAKAAINKFGKSVPDETGLGLAVFDGSGLSERVPLGLGNRPKFYAAVNSVDANGGTPLSSAIEIGYEALRAQAIRQLGYGEYHLVVVTDGEANPGYDPGGVVDKITAESPVLIHTIGFHIGTRHSLNQPGRTIYKDAQSPEDLAEGLGAILSEADKF
jgi:Ca-activated chloride channel homolog